LIRREGCRKVKCQREDVVDVTFKRIPVNAPFLSLATTKLVSFSMFEVDLGGMESIP
jgi:hypothetical protein